MNKHKAKAPYIRARAIVLFLICCTQHCCSWPCCTQSCSFWPCPTPSWCTWSCCTWPCQTWSYRTRSSHNVWRFQSSAINNAIVINCVIFKCILETTYTTIITTSKNNLIIEKPWHLKTYFLNNVQLKATHKQLCLKKQKKKLHLWIRFQSSSKITKIILKNESFL